MSRNGKVEIRVLSQHAGLTVGASQMTWSSSTGRARLAAIILLFMLLAPIVFNGADSKTLPLSTPPPVSLEEMLGDPNMPLLANALVSVCTASQSDWLAYCEGYIDGTIHFWKMWMACASADPHDQSYCAGATAARERFQTLQQACDDCSYDTFLPEGSPDAERFKLFKERRQRFTAEMKAALGVCAPDKQHDEFYCMGYNAVVANSIAEDLSFIASESLSPRDLGRGTAQFDLFAHLFADEEFYGIAPCIPIRFSPQDARDTMLEFVRDYPEQQDTTAVKLVGRAMYYRVCPGPAQQLCPHMEQCTTWSYDSGELGTVNTCNQSVFIQFLIQGQPLIEQTLDPGQAYSTGMTRNEMRGEWIFTTCPVGYTSSVAVSTENWEVIQSSEYSCVKQ